VKVLNAFVAIFLFSSPLISQQQAVKAPASCGEMHAKVLVDLDATQHRILPPETGKARIFFLFDYGGALAWSYPFLKVGIDGQWVGGLAKNSWFSKSVEPGEQHLCVATKDGVVGLAHLTVEGGKTYYYRVRAFTNGVYLFYTGPDRVDSDEAAFQIGQFSLTTIHVKR